MKTVKLFLSALLCVAFVSCANESMVDDGATGIVDNTVPIEFNSLAKAKSRASHEESAAKLGNKFLLYGTKTKAGVTSPVFDNYVVEYEAGSAASSQSPSNTKDWEYAGKTSRKGAIQSVKYWDFSAERFDFVAAAGVAATELFENTSGGMRIDVPDAASMTDIYVADRVTATPTAKAATTTTPATEAYKSTIQFQFRRIGAQMRIGFYETVDGYAIKDLIFYYIGAPTGSYDVGVGAAFPQTGKYTVNYDDATNAAVVKFAGASNKLAFSNSFGKLDYTSVKTQADASGNYYLDVDGTSSDTPVKAFLGTNSAEATYGVGSYTIDGTPGVTSAFRPILPYEENSLKMQLRVDYTLIALDGSGDSIHVRDAWVSVPADFVKWKPNHSYTYLFKISDNSNGYTGKGGGGTVTVGPGRDPDPDKVGDNDPIVDPTTGEVVPPYIPDPSYPEITDPDDPANTIPDPNAPLVPNYPDGPKGDQHDPSNPVPVPEIPDPDDPGSTIPDPENPSNLFPITFDAVVVEAEDASTTVYTIVDGTDNSSETEH